MKKAVLLICTGVILSSVMTSCEKSYTCECVNSKGVPSTHNVVAKSRTEAQTNCDEYGLLGHCEIK